MAGLSIRVIDNTALVKQASEAQIKRALTIMGETAEGYAKLKCPVDTGRLRNSITHEVNTDGKFVRIGTNVEYAPYVEFGTGRNAHSGMGGNQSRGGQKPQPYLRPAIADHVSEYKEIAERELRS